jgi:hypothetical protein
MVGGFYAIVWDFSRLGVPGSAQSLPCDDSTLRQTQSLGV